MPDIGQNRCRWLMRYEYGATVNAPSKKGPSARLEPIMNEGFSLTVWPPALPQDRGAMVACAKGNCGRVRTDADSADAWSRSNNFRRSKKLERK